MNKINPSYTPPLERVVYKTGTIQWWGYKCLELEEFLLSHHAKMGEYGKHNGYYIIYNDIECFATVALIGELWLILKIMPIQNWDNIGNGMGMMVKKEFITDRHE